MCAERPRVLHVFPTFAVGGAQRVAAAVMRASAHLFEHHVLALDGRFEAARGLDGIALHDGRAFPTLRARRRFLREGGFALLVTCNWGSFDWVLAAHLPFTLLPHVHSEHGFGPDEARRRHLRRDFARAVLLRRARALLVPSRTLVRIARRGWGLPRRLVRYVPNGVPLLPPAEPERRKDGTVVVGVVAPLRPEKRIDRLIEALALLPPEPAVRLEIAGDGPERPRLGALAARLGVADRVTLLGHREDVASVLRRFDVFALASDTEQRPLSLLEAAMAGLPVVARDVGDVRLMVAPANRSYIVSGGTARELAAALAELVRDAARRARLGAENRSFALRFHREEAMVRRWIGVLLRALGTEDHAGPAVDPGRRAMAGCGALPARAAAVPRRG
ncbi:N-acetyl-alpha-D-glucosaminyl L-malate synthase [bacterium HR39]|nr:N-acetyl-alpha-D-glucosaminyl L-malate synthase [bacterium HR39]